MKVSRSQILIVVATVLSGPASTMAGEPAECPQCGCPVRQVESLLSKVPYLSRLFKNSAAKEEVQQVSEQRAETPPSVRALPPNAVLPPVFRFVGPDGLERVGVDFDCTVTTHCAEANCPARQCPAKECSTACKDESCPAADRCPSLNNDVTLPRYTAPTMAGVPHGPMMGGFMGPLPGPMAMPMPIAMPQPPQGDLLQSLEAMRAEFSERERELLGMVSQARVEAAGAKAKAKAQQEFAAREAAMTKELLAAQLENAKLMAKLELVAEKEKLASQLRQAHAEAEMLKAQVEIASLKSQLLERQQREESTARKPTESRR